MTGLPGMDIEGLEFGLERLTRFQAEKLSSVHNRLKSTFPTSNHLAPKLVLEATAFSQHPFPTCAKVVNVSNIPKPSRFPKFWMESHAGHSMVHASEPWTHRGYGPLTHSSMCRSLIKAAAAATTLKKGPQFPAQIPTTL